MSGVEFNKVMAITMADEGEIVRYFRMICQLLRQIQDAKMASDALKEKARQTFQKMNRGIIDAERQLRA